MSEQRPTPEQMLERAALEGEGAPRGKLKIYFGAAPGVGKTYAMLESALTRRREGVDVVVGWIETHGRPETERLVRDLERIPPREIEYRGVVLREFDLDAALQRRPQLILVDELAHTNAAGSRHSRRWRDVEELLAAGIDVDTTLNVQHVESLNDIVAQVTGVLVRETVPDALVDRADQIEVVDLTPDELLERLRQGKVYMGAQAERAAASFFRKGNLIALRELALRRAAERVDAQASEWKRAHGVAEPWTMRELILVALSASQESSNVVRAAYRMAARLRAPWVALLVETPEVQRLSQDSREPLEAALELADQLGAQTLVVRGESVAEEILFAARSRNATRIVLAKPAGGPLARLRDTLVVGRVVRAALGIDVVLTSGSSEEPPLQPAPRRESGQRASHYGLALAAVAISAGLCWLVTPMLSLADCAMIFLLGNLAVASRVPRLPALFAAIASVAALDFFFVPPYLTFAIEDLRYTVTFGVMLIVALTVSSFTVRLREQAEAAQQRERRTAALFAMSQQLVIESGIPQIASTAVRHVRELMEADAIVLLIDAAGNVQACGGDAESFALSERELAVARWVHENGRLAGHGTETLPSVDGLYIPLVGTGGHLGVFGIAIGRRRGPPTRSQRQVLETLVAQTALALERALLVERSARAQISAETERTRSELLSSVTHDVRTPLASIRGAAEVLLDSATRLTEDARQELLHNIRDESERLGLLVSDLLDLTRLESRHGLELHREAYPVDELVDSALSRLRDGLAGRELIRRLPEEVLMVDVDAILIEQLLVNLLQNALKFSPAGSPIEIGVRQAGGEVRFEVSDRGVGIPPGQEELIFERFYRAGDKTRAAGSGLGLTICRAIARVHAGSVSARAREGGGALFTLHLPLHAEGSRA